MSVRTRCPTGAGRTLSAGISRATGILQRGLCGHGIILDRRRRTGNGALLGQPGAEVDQPAALAAERAKRGALPGELTLAGGAVDAHRTHRPGPSGAAAEREGHVRLGLGRARGQSIPGEEADVAAGMTAADLRVEPRSEERRVGKEWRSR